MSASLLAIRPAVPADIPALHALVESAYRGDTARRGWTHEADLLGGQRTDAESLAGMIAGEGALLLAESAGALVGCVHVKPAVAPGTAYLGLFTIAPERQAAGLGRQLLAAAEAHAAQALGARAMEMTVIRQRGELIAWYERRGYALTGEERPFPHGDARFGLPRRDDLAFAVLSKVLAD